MFILKKLGGVFVCGAVSAIGGFIGTKFIQDITDPYKRACRKSKIKNVKLRVVK